MCNISAVIQHVPEEVITTAIHETDIPGWHCTNCRMPKRTPNTREQGSKIKQHLWNGNRYIKNRSPNQQQAEADLKILYWQSQTGEGPKICVSWRTITETGEWDVIGKGYATTWVLFKDCTPFGSQRASRKKQNSNCIALLYHPSSSTDLYS